MHNVIRFRYTIAPWGCKGHILRERLRKILENPILRNLLGAPSPPGCTGLLRGCRNTAPPFPRATLQGEAGGSSPHYARDTAARSWRWSCHRATIPRYRGTGPEAYLFSTSQGSKPEDARLPAVQNGAPRRGQGWSAPEGLRDRGAKRIRSLYLPWMTEVTPKLSTTTPPKGLALFSTINDATMRLCRADLPATAHSSPRACRGRSAPTAFLLTEPTARREGRP